MPLRNALFEEESKRPLLGMDSTTPGGALAARPGWLRAAYNVRFGQSSGFSKRGGYAEELLTAWGTRSITAGIQYTTPAGLREVVVFGHDGVNGALGKKSAGAISSLATADPAGTALQTTRPSFVQIDTRLFAFFGTANAPLLYDGTSVRQVGITPPSTSPSLSGTTGGSLISEASYLVAYTFYNANTGAESTPSEPSQIILGESDTAISVTDIEAGDSDTATHVRLYRSDAGGLNLYLDSEIAIGTTTVTLTLHDAALSARQLEIDNSRITDFTSSPQYAIGVGNRIFLKSGSNEIRYSKLGQDGPMPESFEVKAFVDTEGTTGASDDIIGLGAAGSTVVVVKERSVGVLVPIGSPDQRFSSDQVIFIYREVLRNISPVGHWSIASVGNECVLLLHDNILAINEDGNFRFVGANLRNTLRSFGFASAQRERLSAVVDSDQQAVLFSCFSGIGAAHPDWVLVGDFQRSDPNTGSVFFRWSIDRPGLTASQPGYAVGCFFTQKNSVSGKYETVFGNDWDDGQLYKLNDGESDNGGGIYMHVITRPYDYGMPYVQKLHKGLIAAVRGDGSNYDLTVGAIFGLGTAPDISDTINLETEKAKWDVALWDVDVWPDAGVVDVEFDTHRRSRYVQYVFENVNADEPITVDEWTGVASGQRF